MTNSKILKYYYTILFTLLSFSHICNSNAALSDHLTIFRNTSLDVDIRTAAAKDLINFLHLPSVQAAFAEHIEKISIIPPKDIPGEFATYYPLVEFLGHAPAALEWLVHSYLTESVSSKIELWENVLHRQMMNGFDPEVFILPQLDNYNPSVQIRVKNFLRRNKVQAEQTAQVHLETEIDAVQKWVLRLCGKRKAYDDLISENAESVVASVTPAIPQVKSDFLPPPSRNRTSPPVDSANESGSIWSWIAGPLLLLLVVTGVIRWLHRQERL